MAKTAEKLTYILGALIEASIERRELLGIVQTILSKVEDMSESQNKVQGLIHDLQATMENQTTVIGGFQAFLAAHDAALAQTIQTQLNAGASPDIVAPLQALRDGYKANTDALTASLVTRTPADPANAAPVVSTPAAPLLPPVPEAPAPTVDAPAAPAAGVAEQAPAATPPATTGDGSAPAASVFGEATGNAGNQ